MKISELKANTAIPEIELEITSKGEVKEWANARGAGKLCNCAGKDSEGKEVSVTLWNDQIDQVKEGDKIKITTGWCSEFRGDKQVSAGRKGTLEVLK